MHDTTIKPESLLSGPWKPPMADVPYIISTLVASAAVLLIGLLYVALMLAAAVAAPCVAVGVGMASDFQVPPGAKVFIWIVCGVLFPLGLIVAGGMFKAIVPPKAREEEQCVIHRNEEPLLWAVIEQMCKTMVTPVPRRIVVLHNGNRLTGRYRNAYERTVGELAEIAMAMERALDAQQAKPAKV